MIKEEIKMKVPEVRFEGYEGEWERKSLDEIVSFTRGRALAWSDIKENGKYKCILYGNLYTDYGMVIDDVVYSTNSFTHDLTISQSGDVLIPASDTTPTGLARASSIELDNILLGGDINVLRPKESVHGSFLSYNINSNKDQLIKLIKGITVRHLHNSDLASVNLYIPSNISEQKEVSTILRTIDNQISHQRTKLQKLQQIKQAMLTKMFPQDGAKVPEVRFEGFEGDWEEKKLWDVADIVGGGTPSTDNPQYWNGDINWYSPTEIGESVYTTKSERQITKLGLEKSSAKLLPPFKTILFTSRAGIGDMAILERSGCTNQGFQSLVLKSNYDTYFIYSMGNKIKEYALTNASGSTFLEISGKKLGDMILYIPSYNEQSQIGSFFQQLDTLLAQHQKQLDKLGQIKSALLDKLFV